MSKRLLVLFLLAVVTGLTVAYSQTSSNTADESKILALENAWNLAQKDHDANALNLLVADTFINTDWDGTFSNKAQFLADAKDLTYKADQVGNENVVVKMYGNAAVVAGIYHTRGTNKGKPFDHRGRFTDTWVKIDGKWQCVASHTNLISK